MSQRTHTTSAVVIIGALFFLFGFVTWINGPLISYLKIVCELKDGAEPFYVTFAFYIAYFFTALPMAWVLGKTGMKRGMMYGLFTMALGALLFIPAAQGRSYGLFLAGLFIIGTGLSLLQTASNPYITVVGPIESAAARISVMGICNKMAGVLAPFVLGFLLLADADTLQADINALEGPLLAARLDELAQRVIVPYGVMAAFLVALGLMIKFSPLPELDPEVDAPGVPTDGRSIFSFPNLMLGVLALFLYVGVEVMAGDTIGIYGQSLGLPLSVAKHFTSYTLIGMVVGYVIGIIAIPRFISQSKALAASAVLGVVLTIAATLLPAHASILCIALLGLANALVWPAIWPLAISGLGRHTKTGSALLVMAIAGGAILPLIYGKLAEEPGIGHQHAYWMMVPCYLFILWYGLVGHRKKVW
ncbi:MAG: sugar MFS transporter [Flavobacteriales bacterium]|jgi:glucose/galactose transporter|nr:sugar MFS transporter [Flavobacteriales bacterium]MCB0759238.1 sugar MFS transporter [Flavobacteriales bacterium]